MDSSLGGGPPCLPLFGLSMEVTVNGRQWLPWSVWTVEGFVTTAMATRGTSVVIMNTRAIVYVERDTYIVRDPPRSRFLFRILPPLSLVPHPPPSLRPLAFPTLSIISDISRNAFDHL